MQNINWTKTENGRFTSEAGFVIFKSRGFWSILLPSRTNVIAAADGVHAYCTKSIKEAKARAEQAIAELAI